MIQWGNNGSELKAEAVAFNQTDLKIGCIRKWRARGVIATCFSGI